MDELRAAAARAHREAEEARAAESRRKADEAHLVEQERLNRYRTEWTAVTRHLLEDAGLGAWEWEIEGGTTNGGTEEVNVRHGDVQLLVKTPLHATRAREGVVVFVVRYTRTTGSYPDHHAIRNLEDLGRELAAEEQRHREDMARD